MFEHVSRKIEMMHSDTKISAYEIFEHISWRWLHGSFVRCMASLFKPNMWSSTENWCKYQNIRLWDISEDFLKMVVWRHKFCYGWPLLLKWRDTKFRSMIFLLYHHSPDEEVRTYFETSWPFTIKEVVIQSMCLS